MYKKHSLEFMVGLFMLAGAIAFVVLALQVSGLTSYSMGPTYQITANFENVGDLKARAMVTVAGVNVGRVTDIALNPATFAAVVTLNIENKYNNIPTDSTANIYTAGLLGANYISIVPGFDSTVLKNGGVIEHTNQAMILQDLIGKFMFNTNKTQSATTK